MRQIGDKVRLIKAQSVNHFAVANMPITGEIEDIDRSRFSNRFYRIRFDDGRDGWYATDEIRGVK